MTVTDKERLNEIRERYADMPGPHHFLLELLDKRDAQLANLQTIYGTLVHGEFRVCGEDHITHKARVVGIEELK